MSARNVVCFWNWKLQTPLRFSTVKSQDSLHCIDQSADPTVWKQYLKDLFTNQPTASYLLMLHEQPEFPASKHAEIIQYFEGKEWVIRRFSGGKEFIYFSEVDNTGLFSRGALVKNKLFMDTGKKYSVLDDQDRILDHYFDGVWSHYMCCKVKRDLFEAHEKIQTLLVSNVGQLHPDGLIAYAEQNGKKDLLNYLQNHLSVEEMQKGIADLPHAEEIFQLHTSLFEYLRRDMNAPGYQSELNRLFVAIMDKLPGNIY